MLYRKRGSMELIIVRTYYRTGTNGLLYAGDTFLSGTIELPWRNNETGLSCIPEGSYSLVIRHSQRFGRHLHLPDVPGRSLILIHPANSALKELRGCIAPVIKHTGPGMGLNSRVPFEKLCDLVEAAIKAGETVTLEIRKAG